MLAWVLGRHDRCESETRTWYRLALVVFTRQYLDILNFDCFFRLVVIGSAERRFFEDVGGRQPGTGVGGSGGRRVEQPKRPGFIS